MAKVAFSKFGLKTNQDIQIVEFGGQNIEVKQYLPSNDKLALISDVINESADGNNFTNPIKTEVFIALCVLEYYTNITFTDTQRKDPSKIYDIVKSSGLLDTIIAAIPAEEYGTIYSGVYSSINAIYSYKNSVLGILEAVTADYSALDYNATDIQQKLADPNNMGLLKDILSKLG